MKGYLLIPGIERFVQSVQPEEMDEFHNVADKWGIPAVERCTGGFLTMMTAMSRPSKVLELGCGNGVSTEYLTKGAPNAFFTCVDLNGDRLKYAEKQFEGRKQHKFVQGRAEVFLKETDEKFDFVFVDTIKRHYPVIFELLKDKLNEGGVVVFDDVLLYGFQAAKECEIPIKYKRTVREVNDFINYVMKNHPYNATLIPLGDGLLVYRKG